MTAANASNANSAEESLGVEGVRQGGSGSG